MESDRILALIQTYISKMPPLPVTVTKVLKICNDANASATDLNRIISLDPVLAGKALKLVNSAYYGLSQEVTSLVHAIVMLGVNTVKNMVFSTAVLSTLGSSKNFQSLDMMGFWQHSLSVGVTSKYLAKRRQIPRSLLEEYFIAGLLHDIGKIPLNNKFADSYNQVMKRAGETQEPLYRLEKKILGIDHTDVGKLIAQKWRLGSELMDATAHHHNLKAYRGQHRELLITVAVADFFANDKNLGFSGNPYPDKIDPELLKELTITPEYLKDIIEEVDSEIETAQIFLSIAG